ncbi:efflux RND transporter periplasmic adaptor subunit [Alteromonas sp. a30]|uniref:efflux RND transporter periplasmic adaptor subunit n=1 Tax=Alteromonas sp. a30 TaxID=2730917 RepID=UPI00227F3952|nr:efflux RND transporter periplasmic adaptor subunit [Alteromonas sp. a30]MCY7295559.1 efflux RND transporter periplasmic adaptor subunit [Alteromonas sp. a30]
MSRKSAFSPIAVALVVVIALLIYLNLPEAQKQGNQNRPAPPVKLAAASMKALPIVVEALGTARANEALTITAQETDTISQILFDDGDLVKQGQVLVRLNSNEEQAKVEELRINLKEQKRQLKRIADLAQTNSASAQLLDEQQANVDALKAQLEIAKSQISDRIIYAPFSGLLGIRQVSQGALVRPGDVITTLDDLSTIKLDFTISEEHLPSLARNQSITATSVAYPGEIFEGKVSSIASRIDPVTRAVQVRALIANPELKLRPGMLLKVTVEKRVLDALMINETAVVPIGDKQYVYRVDTDNKAQRVEVVVGERRPGSVQIISGLNEGDNIVVEGAFRLSDGAPVNPVGE